MKYFVNCCLLGSMCIAILLFCNSPVFAAGNLTLTCDSNRIHYSLKNVFPACPRNGAAYPGDVVLLESSGSTVSTRQSPVNIDQKAVFEGNGRRVESRIYALEPNSYYGTENGTFKANVVVPRELPAGVYDVSFKVVQNSCNYSKGVPCITDIAQARLDVFPAASSDDLHKLCDKGESGAPSSSTCQQTSSFSFTTSGSLRTQTDQGLYFYLRGADGKYLNYSYLSALLNHSAKGISSIGVAPGDYRVVLRSSIAEAKMSPTDWEIIGPSIKVISRIIPSVLPVGEKPVTSPEQPVEHTKVQLTDLQSLKPAYNTPSFPRKLPNSLISGEHFTVSVRWLSGPPFREYHSAKLMVGKNDKGTFKSIAPLGQMELTSWWQYQTLFENGNLYTFSVDLPSTLESGKYVLRVESLDSMNDARYYSADLSVDVEKIKVPKPTLKLPAQIRQNGTFIGSGTDFPSGAKIT